MKDIHSCSRPSSCLASPPSRVVRTVRVRCRLKPIRFSRGSFECLQGPCTAANPCLLIQKEFRRRAPGAPDARTEKEPRLFGKPSSAAHRAHTLLGSLMWIQCSGYRTVQVPLTLHVEVAVRSPGPRGNGRCAGQLALRWFACSLPKAGMATFPSAAHPNRVVNNNCDAR